MQSYKHLKSLNDIWKLFLCYFQNFLGKIILILEVLGIFISLMIFKVYFSFWWF